MIKEFKIYIVVMVGLFVIAGCTETRDTETEVESDTTTTESEMGAMNQDVMATATASLNPTEGNNVQGSVTFTQTGDAVQVEGDISGLTEGMHGFHIHEKGDCSAPDASSAGGHFNPNNNEHGARTDSVRHMGDLGNIEADAQGNASISFTDSVLVFNQIISKAVIVHAGEDDLTSQPSGAAGSRVACGVIERTNAQANTTMNSENSNM